MSNGKYILIEFDDDDKADALCAQINAAEEKGKPFRLIGIFPRPPQKRCECGPSDPRMRRVKRHKKLGFYYCVKCRRVRPGPQSPQNQLDPRAPNRFGPYLSLSGDDKPTPNFPFLESYS